VHGEIFVRSVTQVVGTRSATRRRPGEGGERAREWAGKGAGLN
jgi:hypothetical protein